MRVVGGATYIPQSVSTGKSLNAESSRWARFRQATTRDTQLAVRVRTPEDGSPKNFVATGVDKNKFTRFTAYRPGAVVSQSKLNTANKILDNANLNHASLTNQDKVHFARMAVLAPDGAKAIYERLGNLDAGVRSALLALENDGAALTLSRDVDDGTNQPRKLTNAQALAAIANLATIQKASPEAAGYLALLARSNPAALSELATLASAIDHGTVNKDQGLAILVQAKNLPVAATALSQLLRASGTSADTKSFFSAQAPLAGQADAATQSRVAQIGSASPLAGKVVADLAGSGKKLDFAFDPTLPGRLARQVSNDVNAGGLISSAPANQGVVNQEILSSFNRLLTEEFGATLATQIWTNVLQTPFNGSQALTPTLMQQAMTAAAAAQDAAIAKFGAPTATLQEISDAKTQSALKAFNANLKSGGFSNPETAEIYRSELTAVLTHIAQQTWSVDATPNHELLTKVARQIAHREFDDKAVSIITQHLADTEMLDKKTTQPYSFAESIAHLVDGAGFATLKTTTYPFAGHLLSTAQAHVGVSLATAFTNLATDLANGANPLGVQFFGGQLLGGLHDVVITGSDPHKQGERVLVFNFGPGVMGGATDRRIVYKPRDVGIDAMMTGTGGVPGKGPSLADIVNGKLVGSSVPSYKFLQGPGAPTNYGYVEYLSNRTFADVTLTPTQAHAFYRDFGRQMAMFTMLGGRDLHHGNMFVSGGRPYFTDMEIAFDQDLFDAISNRDLNGSVVQTSGWEALRSHSEGERGAGAYVDSDRLVWDDKRVRSAPVVESYLMVQGMENGSPVDIDNVYKADANKKNAHQRYADDIAAGFTEVIDLFANADATLQTQLTNFITSMNGLDVRVHPIATGLQLGSLQSAMLDKLDVTDQGAAHFGAKVDGALNDQNRGDRLNARPNTDNAIATRVKAMVVGDFQNGDVAYFTRQLGSQTLTHHGAGGPTAITVNAATGNTIFYPDNGLASVTQLFQDLRAPGSTLKTFMHQLADAWKAQAQNSVSGGPPPQAEFLAKLS